MPGLKKEGRVTVAAVCTALNGIGGINRHMLNLYNGIDRDKYRFIIAYSSDRKVDVERFFLDGGVSERDLFYLPAYKKMLFIPLVLRLHRILDAENVDVLHTFFLHSDILGFFSALGTGVRRLISSVEGKFLLDELNGVGRAKQACYKLINSVIRPSFYRTVAVSSELKNELLSYPVFRQEKIEVINVGVVLPAQSGTAGRRNNGRVIAALSRFSKDKQLEYFLRAVPGVVKEFPAAKFVLAGTGPEENRLKGLSAELGIEEYVSFPGWIGDVENFVKGIDVFVMTSAREGCPVALLEALSFAKPAVAFDVPGVKEIISSGENGILVEPLNLDQLTSAILKVCNEPEYARFLGENGRRAVEEKFSLDAEIERMESLYA